MQSKEEQSQSKGKGKESKNEAAKDRRKSSRGSTEDKCKTDKEDASKKGKGSSSRSKEKGRDLKSTAKDKEKDEKESKKKPAKEKEEAKQDKAKQDKAAKAEEKKAPVKNSNKVSSQYHIPIPPWLLVCSQHLQQKSVLCASFVQPRVAMQQYNCCLVHLLSNKKLPCNLTCVDSCTFSNPGWGRQDTWQAAGRGNAFTEHRAQWPTSQEGQGRNFRQ